MPINSKGRYRIDVGSMDGPPWRPILRITDTDKGNHADVWMRPKEFVKLRDRITEELERYYNLLSDQQGDY